MSNIAPVQNSTHNSVLTDHNPQSEDNSGNNNNTTNNRNSRTSPPNSGTQGQHPASASASHTGGYSLSPTLVETRHDYTRSNFPSTPQYDHTYLDSAPLSPFFRSSPKVTPHRHPVITKISLPSPQYSNKMNHSIKHDAVPGVDQILRASDYPHEPVQGPGEDGSGDNSSPPRESNLLRNAKVSVVSPPEGEAGGRRGPEVSQPGYDMPTGEYFYLFLIHISYFVSVCSGVLSITSFCSF
jgi:hypothetical protein